MSGPFWSKPLWDSDSDNDGESDGWFSAPSVMSIAKIAVSVAGGGPWMSFALDALDTAANVAMGNMSLKDGVTGLGKSGLTSVASGFASGIGAGIGDSIASAGLGSVTASVASSVATSYANTYISGAINSLEFDGGLSFNKDKFKQSTKGGWKSAAISGTTALVSSSIMSAGGAKWSNGRMGFTDKVGGSLEFANSWQKSISTIGNTAGAIAGQSLSAGFGNGFTMNFKGALQLQIGGRNSGLSVGGGGVSLDGIAGMMRGLGQLSDMKKSKEVQFLLNNHNSSEGMARMTYVNWGIKSGNENAAMTSWDVINGDKSLVFNKDLKEGHFGHAGVNNNQIQLNADAINISQDTLGKAGFYTSTMAREGYLIDRNHALGVSGLSDQEMKDSGFGAMLTREAFKMQSGVLGDIAGNMGVKFGGEWGGMKTLIDDVAKTGNLFGWKNTGRDFSSDGVIANAGQDMTFGPGGSSKSAFYLQHLANGLKNSTTIILKDGSVIRNTKEGGIQIIQSGGRTRNLRGTEDFKALLDGASKDGSFNGVSYVDSAKGADDFLSINLQHYGNYIYQSQKNDGKNVNNGNNDPYARSGSTYSIVESQQLFLSDAGNDPSKRLDGNNNRYYYYNYGFKKWHLSDTQDPEGQHSYVQNTLDPNIGSFSPFSWFNQNINCIYTGKINALKSEGLLRPDAQILDLNRNELKNVPKHLGNSTPLDYLMLHEAQKSDWAQITGSAFKTYEWMQTYDVNNTAYVSHFNNGGVVFHYGSGHTTTQYSLVYISFCKNT